MPGAPSSVLVLQSTVYHLNKAYVHNISYRKALVLPEPGKNDAGLRYRLLWYLY